MTKHIHVFTTSDLAKTRIYTTDSPDWEESKHPRAENGQFGKGSGGAKPVKKSAPIKSSKEDPDEELVSMPMKGSGTEKTFAIPKPPSGVKGGPEKGRGPVDLRNQRQETLSSRQAALREMGSSRYAGRMTTPPLVAGRSGSGTVINHQPSGTVIPHQSAPWTPKDVYAAHRKDAGTKGQAALDLALEAEASRDPAKYEKAIKALQESEKAHRVAAKSAREIPYPGNASPWEHHDERASAHAKRAQELTSKLKALTATKQPSLAKMKAHPQFTQEDYDYLKGKGWTNSEIHQRWDEERGQGNAPVMGKNLSKIPNVTGVIGNPNFYKK